MACLSDDLIRPRQERLRNGQAHRVCRLEIDHELKARGLLDGKIGGFGTLEDFAHVSRRLSSHVDAIGSVGHQSTRLNVCSIRCVTSSIQYEVCSRQIPEFAQTT